LGAASRYLGQLAATTGRHGEAAEHFEHALAANARLGAVVELAHTQIDYAASLGPTARAEELIDAARRTAEERDLPLVAERAAALVTT
jgi:uncharacterized protein HemY